MDIITWWQDSPPQSVLMPKVCSIQQLFVINIIKKGKLLPTELQFGHPVSWRYKIKNNSYDIAHIYSP
jgi:hypothetical protein